MQIPGELQQARPGHRARAAAGAQRSSALLGRRDDGARARSASGTTFTRRAAAAAARSSPALPDLTGAVLVVDDDETARYVVEAHLRDTAWRTVPVDGGEAALAALSAQRCPAAMILDLSMPDLDGLEVLRRMRADAQDGRRAGDHPHVTAARAPARSSGSQALRRAACSTSPTRRARSCWRSLSIATRAAAMTAEPSILLADDDEVGRYVIATMLRRAGFTVREVADGRRRGGGGRRRAARPRGARREDARARRLRGVPADQVRRGARATSRC